MADKCVMVKAKKDVFPFERYGKDGEGRPEVRHPTPKVKIPAGHQVEINLSHRETKWDGKVHVKGGIWTTGNADMGSKYPMYFICNGKGRVDGTVVSVSGMFVRCDHVD
ncbi:MAG: hypothetical protein ISR58_02225 [Anaerolineales bacterium]|nr:hypothetical protein [Chloroflexota bacterium]MBL6979984.1 hypothetical protein [Anaerolineales bacterium]